MRFVTGEDLADYLAVGDPLADFLGRMDSVGERWLWESPAKRMIAWELYGDLLLSRGRRVLDVGACKSSLTRELYWRHDYVRCDLGEHDGRNGSDWRDITAAAYDVVIANDVFPNVDQGLREFLTRFYGNGELRMSLTTYPDRHYRAKRVGADELLTVQAWDWAHTLSVLRPFNVVLDARGEVFPPSESLFANGRQVALFTC